MGRNECGMLLLLQLCLSPVSGLPSSCPCLPAPACAWPPYGSHPLDIALLGIHPPCAEYGEVRCCDKAAFGRYYEDYAAEILKSHNNSSSEEMSDIIFEDELMHESSNSWDNPTRRYQSISTSEDLLCGCLKKSVCPPEFWNPDSGHCEDSLVMCCVGKHDSNPDSKSKSKQLETMESDFEFVHESLQTTSLSAAADTTTPIKAKFPEDVTDANSWMTHAATVTSKSDFSLEDNYLIRGKRVRLGLAPPPAVTIVPCLASCDGKGRSYSTHSPAHRAQFGLLAPCSPPLVRCILVLDLGMFLYADNFNLPIFNAEDFVQHVTNEKVDGDGDSGAHTTPLENNVSTLFQPTPTKSPVSHQSTSAENVTQSVDLFLETENNEYMDLPQTAKNVSRIAEEDETTEDNELTVHVSPRENYSKPFLDIEEGALNINGMKNDTKYSEANLTNNKKLNDSTDQLGPQKSLPEKVDHHKTPESNTISLFNKLKFPLVETITEKSTTIAPTKSTTPTTRMTAEPEEIENSVLQDTRILSTLNSASNPAEVTLNYMSTPKPLTASGPLPNHSTVSQIIDDIFKVGIDMDVSDEAARVMVLMETGMKEAEVEKEKLLPVLQALMDVLEEIEREREHEIQLNV